MCDVVHSFFVSGFIMPEFNSNMMVLIPKTKDADSIDKFRPIIFGNFVYKIISKILADRLAKIVAHIIAPPQFGFIQGRHIEECIAVASENFNLLDYRSREGNMALKIDIKKAFDSME